MGEVGVHSQCVVLGELLLCTLDRIREELVREGVLHGTYNEMPEIIGRRQVVEHLITTYYKQRMQRNTEKIITVVKEEDRSIQCDTSLVSPLPVAATQTPPTPTVITPSVNLSPSVSLSPLALTPAQKSPDVSSSGGRGRKRGRPSTGKRGRPSKASLSRADKSPSEEPVKKGSRYHQPTISLASLNSPEHTDVQSAGLHTSTSLNTTIETEIADDPTLDFVIEQNPDALSSDGEDNDDDDGGYLDHSDDFTDIKQPIEPYQQNETSPSTSSTSRSQRLPRISLHSESLLADADESLTQASDTPTQATGRTRRKAATKAKAATAQRKLPPLERKRKAYHESRAKLKSNPVAYKQYKEKDAERNRLYRKNLSDGQKERMREFSRMRSKRYRERQKLKPQTKDDKVLTREDEQKAVENKIKKREGWREMKRNYIQKMSQDDKESYRAKRRQYYHDKLSKKNKTVPEDK